MRRAIGSMLAACAATLVLAGCSGAEDVVPGNVVADEVAKRLTTKTRIPESVTCPDDLPRVVGETTRCQLDDGSRVYGVTVTVTAVKDGKSANDTQFDIKVDEQPQ